MRNLFILFFSPGLVYLIYDLIFNLYPIFNEDYKYINYGIILFLIICDVLAIVSLIFFAIKFKAVFNQKESVPIESGGLNKKWYLVFLGFVILCYFFLIYSVFGNFSIINKFMHYSKFYAMSKRGTAWVFFLITIILNLMVYDLYKNGFKRFKVSILIFCLLILGITGGRSQIVIYFFLIAFIYVIIHYKKIPIFMILLGFTLVTLLFIVNSALRAGVQEISESDKEKSAKLDFNNAFMIEDVLSYNNFNDINYLVSSYDFAALFIPRGVWEDKPMSTAETRLIYPIVAKYGTNYTFGIHANALVNFGYLGFFLIPIFIIYSNYLYFKTLLNEKKSYSNFMILMFFVFYLQFIRGGLINSRLFVIFLLTTLGYFGYKVLASKFVLKS